MRGAAHSRICCRLLAPDETRQLEVLPPVVKDVIRVKVIGRIAKTCAALLLSRPLAARPRANRRALACRPRRARVRRRRCLDRREDSGRTQAPLPRRCKRRRGCGCLLAAGKRGAPCGRASPTRCARPCSTSSSRAIRLACWRRPTTAPARLRRAAARCDGGAVAKPVWSVMPAATPAHHALARQAGSAREIFLLCGAPRTSYSKSP